MSAIIPERVCLRSISTLDKKHGPALASDAFPALVPLLARTDDACMLSMPESRKLLQPDDIQSVQTE